MINKMIEAGYIGFMFAGEETLTVPNFIWSCLWIIAFVVGGYFYFLDYG